jgi:hypothetical protein
MIAKAQTICANPRALLFPCNLLTNLTVRLTVPEIRSAMKITLYYATGKEVISNQDKARIHKALHDCGFGAGNLGTWEPGVNYPMRHHVKPRTLPYSHVATTPGSNSGLRDFLPPSHSGYISIFSLTSYSDTLIRVCEQSILTSKLSSMDKHVLLAW